jgi:hypothetical protein
MIVFYFNKNQPHHVRLINQMFASCTVDKLIMPTESFGRNARINQKAQIIVFAGMIRGEGLIYKWCQDNAKKFIYLDHAYLERGYNPEKPASEWMRITENNFSWNKMQPQTSERWDKFFAKKYKVQPWRSNKGENILILPPSLATQYIFPKSIKWLDQTLRTVYQLSNRPIVVREKPLRTELGVQNQVLRRIKHSHANSIEDELAAAHCVITYNSAVPVQAAILGIPTFTNEVGAAHPINFKIEEIENPPDTFRERWLYQLVHHQFRTEELINGDIWKMLKT